MYNTTLRKLQAEIDAHLRDHPEDADLPVYVPYDSQMAMTTVYGGIRREENEGDEPIIVIDGDS